MGETIRAGLILSAYGLLMVFGSLVSFAVLVKLLLRWLPEPGPEPGPGADPGDSRSQPPA